MHVWPNGDRYEGEWKLGLKHGTGSDKLGSGDTYVGEYDSGKMHGKGVYTWSTGQIYNGDYVNGLRHGKGKWRNKDNLTKCNSYEGEYKLDKKHGQGTYTWASGNVYTGEYWEDERNGYGVMTWIDGSRYEGEWLNGIQHGFGKMTFPNGKVKEGIFEDNIFKGDADGNGEQEEETPSRTDQSESYYEDSTGRRQTGQAGLNFFGADTPAKSESNDQAKNDDDDDDASRDHIEVNTGKAQKRMEQDDQDITYEDSFFEPRNSQARAVADGRKIKGQAVQEALNGNSSNMASKRDNYAKPSAGGGLDFMKQARTAVQDQIAFMDQSEVDSSIDSRSEATDHRKRR